MAVSIHDITSITGGVLLQSPCNEPVEDLLIDSRKLSFPGRSVFFALEGPRRTGLDFIPELYARGVRHFVIGKTISLTDFPEANFVLVPHVLAALRAIAAAHRAAFQIPVIGITGSNGKTIVKEWLARLLEKEYSIVRSPKSYNSQIGVPLSVWAMNASHSLGIFEAGISRTGEMEQLEPVIRPVIGLLTHIGEAHSEGFLSRAEKIREKLKLFRRADWLICRIDDAELEGLIRQNLPASTRLFTWATSKEAVLQVTSIEKQEGHSVISALYDGRVQTISIPFTDDASVENAAGCWCVLLHLNIGEEQIRERMKTLHTVAMRLELKKGINNSFLINDSYSADLDSLSIALDFLLQQPQVSRRTLILSDILQSGRSGSELYAEVAALLRQKKIHRLLAIGPGISAEAAAFSAMLEMEQHFYPGTEAFLAAWGQLHFGNEVILLKGARHFAFERISRRLEQKVHQTVLEINLNALADNLKAYQRMIQPGTRLMAMVKAFSYGSGGSEVASLLQFHRVDYLGVAYPDEGVELRKAGISVPIMVLNADEGSFDVLVEYNLEPEIFSFALLDAFEVYLKEAGLQRFPIHIELETGMQRLGFSLEELDRLASRLQQSNAFRVQSVFSHLVASELAEHDAFTQNQGRLLLEACGVLQVALGYSFIRHIANSAGIIRHPNLQLDMVRLGIGLYGADATAREKLQLRDAGTLKTTIAQLKQIKAGETVGYGRRGKVDRDSLVATVRLGYADGYPRRLGNGVGRMLVRGIEVPVLGSVCMDMTMLDVTDVEDLAEGEEVLVFGPGLPIDQLAEWAQTIPYEIMTGISQRVKRVYFEE